MGVGYKNQMYWHLSFLGYQCFLDANEFCRCHKTRCKIYFFLENHCQNSM